MIAPFANTPYASMGLGTRNILQDLVQGPPARSGRHGPGLQPALQDHKTPDSVAETFSREIVRRLEAQQQEDGKDPSRLASSLAETMDHVRERFGGDAATAAMGLVLQKTSGSVTEESLGEGLLAVIKMVDRNYGFAAGDGLIAKFNGELNTSLNDYFDNGLDEKFLAAPMGTHGALQDLKSALNDLRAQLAGDPEQDMLSLLDSAKGPGGLRQALSSWMDQLREEHGEEAGRIASDLLARGLAQRDPSESGPRGQLLDMAV
jgi:hypothetical protein